MSAEVRIQTADFDASEELRAMHAGLGAGAAVFFVGLARDSSSGEKIQHLQLQHYEGMTQKYMQKLVADAKRRWNIMGARMVHRVGKIPHGEQIVFVGALALHRQEAFLACEYMVDHMKTEVPLWKAEHNDKTHRWLHKNHSDLERKQRWEQT